MMVVKCCVYEYGLMIPKGPYTDEEVNAKSKEKNSNNTRDDHEKDKSQDDVNNVKNQRYCS